VKEVYRRRCRRPVAWGDRPAARRTPSRRSRRRRWVRSQPAVGFRVLFLVGGNDGPSWWIFVSESNPFICKSCPF
jgi:hypothetical protein